jgi:hypothetical protein
MWVQGLEPTHLPLLLLLLLLLLQHRLLFQNPRKSRLDNQQ